MDFLTSTAYFPPLAWFVTAQHKGSWHWEAHENYQKGGWRNRCRIATANGPLLLSVPLTGGKHQQMPIREVEISYRDDWWRVHEQTIRSAYGRAPYFEYYAEEIFTVVRQRPLHLWELNETIINTIGSLLQLTVLPVPTTSYWGGAAGQVPDGTGTPYPQVFTERFGFIDGLSVLDALFCLGPELNYLA